MLVSVHTFIREGVEVAIYETHNGGEYDATNVFPKPVVTGIASIGEDHIKQLGPTIENIAWHKAGIFKSGRPAFSAMQEPEIAAVLRLRANDKDAPLNFVNLDSSLPMNTPTLQPDVQKTNASLALALVSTFLQEKAPACSRDLSAQDIDLGVEQFVWIGRFQKVNQEGHQWFLDGAHNDMSVQNAAHWFAEMATLEQT